MTPFFPPFVKPQLVGWYHIIFFGVFLPFRIIQKRGKVMPAAGPLPKRTRVFWSTSLGLLVVTGISLLVAWKEGIVLFVPSWPPFYAVLAGVAFYSAAVGFMRPRWRRAVEKRTRVVHLYMPQTAPERLGWVVVSLAAGLGEEITWRGVQFALLGGLTGDPWTAALITSISFGLGHAVQGWRSVVVILVIGLCFHLLVWLSASLYVAMAVHAAYDVTAGFTYGQLGKELGYSLEPGTPTPAPPVG